MVTDSYTTTTNNTSNTPDNNNTQQPIAITMESSSSISIQNNISNNNNNHSNFDEINDIKHLHDSKKFKSSHSNYRHHHNNYYNIDVHHEESLSTIIPLNHTNYKNNQYSTTITSLSQRIIHFVDQSHFMMACLHANLDFIHTWTTLESFNNHHPNLLLSHHSNCSNSGKITQSLFYHLLLDPIPHSLIQSAFDCLFSRQQQQKQLSIQHAQNLTPIVDRVFGSHPSSSGLEIHRVHYVHFLLVSLYQLSILSNSQPEMNLLKSRTKDNHVHLEREESQSFDHDPAKNTITRTRQILQDLIGFCPLAILHQSIDNGNTFLHVACLLNDSFLVKLFLTKGLNPSKKNNENQMPIDLTDDPEITEMLLILVSSPAITTTSSDSLTITVHSDHENQTITTANITTKKSSSSSQFLVNPSSNLAQKRTTNWVENSCCSSNPEHQSTTNSSF